MKVAVVGEIHQSGWETLKKENFDVIDVKNFDEENLIEELKDVDGILLRTSKLEENVLAQCKKLKIIARHGVGYDNVDINYLNQNGIALGITGTANSVTVAEYVMTAFLYLARKTNYSDILVKEGNFKNKKTLPDFFELYKKNILICGFGRIGKAVAKRCLGFDSNVYIFDPLVDNKEVQKAGCIPIEKNEGIKIADYITLHLPLNDKTKSFISKQELELCKNTAIIVNAARGGIINEKDLINALSNKKIQAAALDVFEQEPPSENHPIFKFENVLLSPHNSALTVECRKRMAVEASETIIFYLKDKSSLNLDNLVNKKYLNI